MVSSKIIQNKTYTSISQFKQDFPESIIRKILGELDTKIGHKRLRFKQSLFDNQFKEFGNNWDSYIESIGVTSQNKIYFDIYVQGDSTDSNETVLYDNFTKSYGNIMVNSPMASTTATYDERDRLMIFNKLASLLRDAVNGADVFYLQK